MAFSPARTAPAETADFLRLLEVEEDGLVVGPAAEVAYLYSVSSAVDVRTCPTEAVGSFLQSATALIAAATPGRDLCFVCRIRPARLQLADPPADADELISRIDAARREHLSQAVKEGSLVEVHRTLCLSVTGRREIRFRRLLPQPGVMREVDAELSRRVKELADFERDVGAAAASCGIQLRRLRRNEVLAYYRSVLVPHETSPFQEIPGVSLRHQLATTNAQELQGGFFIGSRWHVATIPLRLPDPISSEAIDSLLERMPPFSALTATVFGADQKALEAELDKRRGHAKAAAPSEKSQQAQEGRVAAAAQDDIDALLTHRARTGDALARISLSLIFSGDTLKEARDRAYNRADPEYLQKIRKMTVAGDPFSGGVWLVDDRCHARHFFSLLPFGHEYASVAHVTLASAAVNFLPISQPWAGHRRGALLFRGRDGTLVGLDLFHKGSPRHTVIVGSSGAGKSFFINTTVSTLLTDPASRFVIVDVGGSFDRLSEIAGGAYFEVRLSEEFAVNLFPPRSVVWEDSEPDPMEITGILSLIKKMLAAKGTVLQPEKEFLLEKAIVGAYSRSEAPLLGDVERFLEAWEGDAADKAAAAELARSLRIYTSDTGLGRIFNRPTRLRPFEKTITTFDLRLVPDESVRAVLMAAISYGMWSMLMETSSIRKYMIVDEFHEFAKDETGAAFMGSLLRHARKFGGCVILASQSPEDFLKGREELRKAIRVAVNNWIVLRLPPGNEASITEIGFSDQCVELSRHLSKENRVYSEFLALVDEDGPRPARALRLYPDPFLYWMATTGRDEKNEILRLKEAQRLTWLQAIERMARRG